MEDFSIEDFISRHLEELKSYFGNSTATETMNQPQIDYLRGKIDLLNDLIHNSSYDPHQDIDGFSSLVCDYSVKISNLKVKISERDLK